MQWGDLWQSVINRRPRTVAATDLVELGVRAPVVPTWTERPTDTAVENLVAGDGSVVVVTGPALSGKTHTLARAARRLLGDHVLTRRRIDDDDLAALVGRATAPGAVWLDDAPPTVLEQITPELVAALAPGLRLLVTVDERRFPPVFTDPGTAGLLRGPEALVRLDPLPEDVAATMEPGLDEVAAVVGACSAIEKAVLGACWDAVLIGWPGPLPAQVLVEVAAREAGCSAVTAAGTLTGLRRRRAAGEPMIRWTGRGPTEHPWPHPLAIDLAERAQRIPLFDTWWQAMRGLRPEQREAVGRTMLARVGSTAGQDQDEDQDEGRDRDQDAALAPWIGWCVSDADLAIVPAGRASALAGALPRASRGAARRLYQRALEDPALAGDARVPLGELEEAAGRPAEAAEHLRAVADRPRAVVALARIAESVGDTAEARRRHEETLCVGDERQREHAFKALARMAETEDLTTMRRWFMAAAERGAVDLAFVHGAWAEAELRVGEPARARVLLKTAEGWLNRLYLNAAAHMLDGDPDGALRVVGGLGRPGRDYGGMAGLLIVVLSAEAWHPAAIALMRDPEYPDLERGMAFFHLVSGVSAEYGNEHRRARRQFELVFSDDPDEVREPAEAVTLLARYGLARHCAVFGETATARHLYDELAWDRRAEVWAMAQRLDDDYGHLFRR